MKKIKKLLIIMFFVFLVGFGIVFATEYKLKTTWNSDEYKEVNPKFAFDFKAYDYKDGILFFQIDETKENRGSYSTKVYNYTADEKIKENSLGYSEEWVNEYWMFEDKIYYVSDEKYYAYPYLKIINEDLNTNYESVVSIELTQNQKNQLLNKGGYDASLVDTIAKDENGNLVFYTKDDSKTLIRLEKKVNAEDNKEYYEVSQIEYNNENLNKYFPEIYKLETINKASENEKIKYNSFTTLKDGSEVYVGTKTNGDVQVAYMNVIKNNESVWFRNLEKYESFTNPVLVQDFIVLKANYDKEKSFGTQRSDILMYDLKGNLVYTLTSPNTNFNNIISFDDYFVVDKLYVEGSCAVESMGTYELWNADSCDTYYIYEKYIPEKLSSVLSEKEEQKEEEKDDNPNTSALPILVFVVISLGAMVVMKKHTDKLKDMN